MTAETDEQFVERVGLDFDLSNTGDDAAIKLPLPTQENPNG